MTPDWSVDSQPIPHGNLSSPQSLNLYSYTDNNPTSNVDLDGHDCRTLGPVTVYCRKLKKTARDSN